MIEKSVVLIDGSPSFLDGFDASEHMTIDEQIVDYKMSSPWDIYRVIPTEWCGPEGSRFVPTAWNGTKSDISEEKRIAGLKKSWESAERREAAAARMKEARKTMKQNYSDVRNAKISEGMKKVWERRKLEKASQQKENVNG